MFMVSGGKRLLVIGGSSFIGHAYLKTYGSKYKVRYTYFRNQIRIPNAWGRKIDIRNEPRLCELFTEFRPDIVLHCAGMTSLKECEKDWQKTYDVNVRATGDIRSLCNEVGARLIYLSTDMVFDGERRMYEETDDTFPRSRYGKSKQMAEELVYGAGSTNNTVLRLSLVYGLAYGQSRGFLGWMQDAMSTGKPLTLFTDEIRSPVFLEDLVEIIEEVISEDIAGLFHIGAPEPVDRYNFGLRFAQVFGYNPACIRAASINEYTEKPPRPRNLSLNTARAQKRFKTRLCDVEAGLRRMREDFDSRYPEQVQLEDQAELRR